MRSLATSLALVLLVTAFACTNPRVTICLTGPVGTLALHTDSVQVSYELRADGTLRVKVDERDKVTDRWSEQELREEVGFAARAIDARGSHELWLAGVTEEGEDVLELWTRPLRPGGRTAAHPAATSPVGTPLAASALEEQVWPAGATWSPASETDTPRFRRERVFEGQLGGIADLSVDPDGRFVLLLAGSPRSVSRLDLVPRRAEPTVILDTKTETRLADAGELTLAELEGRSRIAFVTDQDPSKYYANGYVVLEDANNDGLFERHVSFGGRSLRFSRYSSEHWTENFFWYGSALDGESPQ